MSIAKAINSLRTDAHLTQEQFADIFDVSQQSVQKWEMGDSVPELNKLIKISKYFGISLDALILDNNDRNIEIEQNIKQLRPEYQVISMWEYYPTDLMVEYNQCVEEGLDIEQYKDVFASVARLPKSEHKRILGDALFNVVLNAKVREDYKYIEPNDLEKIKTLRKPYTYDKVKGADMESRIHGAWLGRTCGCMLGKTVEGIHTDIFIPFLKESGNYPLHRYIYRSDITDEILNKYKFGFLTRPYADDIDCFPADDDMNYTVLYQELINKSGKGFNSNDVATLWLNSQIKNAYCTAERVAFCNFVKGYAPPDSAIHKNPYREWLGGQIRADYFGYINPRNPSLAAEMAWRDARISHVKNGIYGEMFVAAMLAAAAETDNFEDIILAGLGEIPHTSRLYEEVMSVLDGYKKGVSKEDCFNTIHEKYDEYTAHGWCHTAPNAMIVAASLLYGNGDYAKSICMAVETCFDTDCNGATVGSIIGMAKGVEIIPEYWSKPINNKIETTIFGVSTVNITDRVKLTIDHINR
ncbi:MAG: ADP-ribosylglycohydrolase family protein [Clostridia bacterium]|nr:ADP-ribosylglycohydrolase family protein [Clostridia bacterium]